ncbi:SMI1/KNR4 family protein [Aureispira anguillae]|uniref:Leucine-rich repeat domain-containing protein n=1 Tax=Aureispira anguillae TaxID=2864201 RepID=A0A915YDU9_9BACT|nr:SMI1/KNR4 family protein [Aureispira anguillae]BDS11263.1 leucine-rich repeat domain-containing protein [Aureispira anguillae]
MYLNKAKTILKEINPILEKQLLPCSIDEVLQLEKIIQTKLPLALKEFLLWMGKGPSDILCGSDFFYNCWMNNDFLDWAQELLEENKTSTDVIQESFILLFHQGYYFQFIPLNQGDNPPVFEYLEGKKIRKLHASFSTYIEESIVKENCQLPTSLWIDLEEDLTNHNSLDEKIESISFNTFQTSSLPKKIFDFINLKELDLRGLGLKLLSPKIENLVHLKLLNINSNHLENLPKELFALSNLEQLYLSSNRLKKIPPEIKELKKLKSLSINGNLLNKKQIDELQTMLKGVDIYHG